MIQKSLDAKLDEIYGEMNDQELVFIPKDANLLFLTEDGTLAFRCAVEVRKMILTDDLGRFIAYATEFVIPFN